MTSSRRIAHGLASRWAGPIIAAGLCLAPVQAAADAGDLFYERTLMRAADLRCDLFAPPISAALSAGALQARGAALRAGADDADLAEVERRARARAAATSCSAPDLAVAAGRVRSAFEGYARLSRMTYPGDLADWRADRSGSRSRPWRLAQSVSFGWNRMTFGLAGHGRAEALTAVAHFADGRTPYAARLVMRDPQRSPRPYLDRRTDGRPTLARRLPPAGAVTAYMAEARSPAGADLLPADVKSGWAFRFPAEAVQALAALDPREAVAVEFLFSGERETALRAYVEVGDFAAARAFLRLAER